MDFMMSCLVIINMDNEWIIVGILVDIIRYDINIKIEFRIC